MIPKGNLHAHGGRLATYITKGLDGEQAELIETRGLAEDTDLRLAFCQIQAIAEGQTQCEKPFFHAYVRLPADEELSREQWLETANRLEQKLGLDDQPRGVALHFLEDGTTHLHVAWSRIDTDQMKAIDPGLYLRKMKEVCRELEQEYGLRELSSELPADRQTAPARRAEFEEARRLGLEIVDVRETIRACYDRSDNGPSFAAALAEQDLHLARGDRRDFVVVNSEGGMHALGKRICGVEPADIRRRLGDEFRRSLPTVDEARQEIEARREAERRSPTNPAEIASEVTALWRANETGRGFAADLDERGYVLARGDRRDFLLIDIGGNHYALARLIDGARTRDVRAKLVDIDAASLPTLAEAKAEQERGRVQIEQRMKRGRMNEPSEELLAAQAPREAELLRDLADQDKRVQAFKQQREAEAEEARKHEQERRKADERRAAEGDIASASDRYDQALGRNYDVRDPYASLARAAMTEWATFKRQQEDLRKEIAAAKDPQEREALQLRQKIEGCEYMAVTSQRLSEISEVTGGGKDAPQAVLDRERAQAWQDQANQLREQRAQQQAEREKQGREQVAERLGELRRGIEKGDRPRGEVTDRDSEITDAKAARLARQEGRGDGSNQPAQTGQRTGGRGGR
jgi:hypothetical protein